MKVTINREKLKNAIKKIMVKQIQEYLATNPWKGETFESYQGSPRGEHPARYLVQVIDENPYDNIPAVYVVHTYYTDITANCSTDGIINVNIHYRIQENRGTEYEIKRQLGDNIWSYIHWL